MAKRTAMVRPTPTGDWRKITLDPTAVIRVVVETNPKKPSSRAHQKFAELRTGMTVQEYLALEGQRPTLDGEKRWPKLELVWCLHKGYIALDGAVTAEPNGNDELDG